MEYKWKKTGAGYELLGGMIQLYKAGRRWVMKVAEIGEFDLGPRASFDTANRKLDKIRSGDIRALLRSKQEATEKRSPMKSASSKQNLRKNIKKLTEAAGLSSLREYKELVRGRPGLSEAPEPQDPGPSYSYEVNKALEAIADALNAKSLRNDDGRVNAVPTAGRTGGTRGAFDTMNVDYYTTGRKNVEVVLKFVEWKDGWDVTVTKSFGAVKPKAKKARVSLDPKKAADELFQKFCPRRTLVSDLR